MSTSLVYTFSHLYTFVLEFPEKGFDTMNIWTKILYSILFFTVHSAGAVDSKHIDVDLGNCEFRRAEIQDFPAIQALYSQAYEDKEPGIILLPEPFRSLAIKQAIDLGRLFIAVKLPTSESESEEIVSAVKIFVMGASQEGLTAEAARSEESRILTEELRCRAKSRQDLVHCCEKGTCTCPPFKFTYRSANWKPEVQVSPHLRYSSRPEQTYIYFGGAYTYPWYRKNGINSELERRALEDFVIEDVITDIELRKSKQLIYAYGITKRNSATETHIQVFCGFMQAVKNRLELRLNTVSNPLELDCFKFKTFKPEFAMTRDGHGRGLILQPLTDQPGNEGFGCLIVGSLKNSADSKRPVSTSSEREKFPSPRKHSH